MSAVGTINLNDTAGALQIGSLFAVFLFGMVTLQIHMYYQSFKDDKWHLKTLVAAIWVLELGHTFCVTAEIYRATIVNYGRPDKLFPFPFLGASTALGGTIAFLTHSFFAARTWKVLPRWWNCVGLVCFGAALIRFIGSIVLGVNAVKATVLEKYRHDWGWLIMSLLLVGAAIDVLIATSMMFYLVKQREKVFNRAVRLIDKLIQYTICTGLLTSLAAIAMIICFATGPTNMIWLAVYTCLAKLYSNSLIATLNSRTSLRTQASQGSSSNMDPSFRGHRSHVRRETVDPNQVVISVEMKSTVHTAHDDADSPYKSAYPSKQYPLENLSSPKTGYMVAPPDSRIV